jgi:hypothetical protein
VTDKGIILRNSSALDIGENIESIAFEKIAAIVELEGEISSIVKIRQSHSLPRRY